MQTEFLHLFGKPNFFAQTIEDGEESDQINAFVYPGAIPDSWVPGISVHFGPTTGQTWIGHFRSGKLSPNATNFCCAHPDGKHIVVVSAGAGYVVSVSDPAIWHEIPITPIMGYCAKKDDGVLILYDYTRVMGLISDGSTWISRTLSWDGLRSVHIVAGEVKGEGWDASTSSYVTFSVDLKTGSSVGGAAPPDAD